LTNTALIGNREQRRSQHGLLVNDRGLVQLKGSGGFVCLLLGCVIGVKTEMRVLTEKQFGFVQGQVLKHPEWRTPLPQVE